MTGFPSAGSVALRTGSSGSERSAMAVSIKSSSPSVTLIIITCFEPMGVETFGEEDSLLVSGRTAPDDSSGQVRGRATPCWPVWGHGGARQCAGALQGSLGLPLRVR